jgi:hypothetical protein
MPKVRINSLSTIKADPKTIRIGEAIDDLSTGINNIANQLSADPNGADVVPANLAKVQVQHVGGGQIDVALTDNSKINRSVNYYVEYSQDQKFTNSYTLDMGSSRNDHTLRLPNGTWFFRGLSQNPNGGPPSSPVAHPDPIVVVGSSVTGTLFASQGSGTGLPTQAGQGAGKTISR